MKKFNEREYDEAIDQLQSFFNEYESKKRGIQAKNLQETLLISQFVEGISEKKTEVLRLEVSSEYLYIKRF